MPESWAIVEGTSPHIAATAIMREILIRIFDTPKADNRRFLIIRQAPAHKAAEKRFLFRREATAFYAIPFFRDRVGSEQTLHIGKLPLRRRKPGKSPFPHI